ncbi:helix-turn-helix transcriptional regulator [Shouchella clausii]|uniref:helix-turn-helix domain-containing protein n=1 Tax=Shouchella TaxID=2893057 RepID=UPI0004E62752|nr:MULTISPECIES: helix-turn-helix transcriptional regulator [Shouchella]ALA55026.1 HTH-type transcriptional regulator xre [Shouchella clausii]MBU3231000.1 helix-turn-helix domain-containing protein [Shouchella clausii]MBU3262925.1 helix-turn-helix domain-containing protein [Shouchella clausii]MBU3505390.1 helix-turn-helix domain-containing protein [Shouchella clausii]MBU3534407.1 helix-turn-helix domain-containing protein [Shouchella clausii]
MNLGERIRSLREKEELTQKQLAEKLKIPHQNLSNYERNFRQPDYETLNKIASYFDVSVDYLLGRTDNPNSDISIAYDGGIKYEDEDEREFIEQQLEQYRKMKKRMQERLKQDKNN